MTSSDDGEAKWSDVDMEEDPAKIVVYLRGLPPFPDPPDVINNTPDPGFSFSCGPPSLIREVSVPPARDEQAPAEIWKVLDEARIFQNVGSNESARGRLTKAWGLWCDKKSWGALHRGLDPAEDAAKRAEDRARLMALRGDMMEAEKQRQLRVAQRKKDGDDDNDTPHEDDTPINVPDPPPDEPSPPVMVLEVDTEMALYYHNAMGSIWLSEGKDLNALIHFWSAKLSHDEYVQEKELMQSKSKDAKSEASASMRELQALARTEIKPVKKAAVDDTQWMSDNNPDLELSTHALSNLEINKLKPFEYCSPVTAMTFSNLGAACYHLGRYDLAINCYYTSQQIRFQTIPEDADEFVDVGLTLNNLGVCLARMNRFKEAYAYMLSAEELLQQRLDVVHPRLGVVKNNLAKVRPKRGRMGDEEIEVIQSSVKMKDLQLRQWYVALTKFEQLVQKGGGAKKKKKGKGKKKKKK